MGSLVVGSAVNLLFAPISIERGLLQRPDALEAEHSRARPSGRGRRREMRPPAVVPPCHQLARMAQVRRETFETLRIHGNVFHPRSSGVSNRDLPP